MEQQSKEELRKEFTQEHIERFFQLVDDIENRCMASDGPVTPTLQEMQEEELSEIWHIIKLFYDDQKEWQRLSDIAEEETKDANTYLRKHGLNPDKIAEDGIKFVKQVSDNIKLKEQLSAKDAEIKELKEKLNQK